MNAKELVDYISKQGYEVKDLNTNKPYLLINESIVSFDYNSNLWCPDGITIGHKRILDLNKPENASVVMLVLSLLKKGYSKDVITLEKKWQLGHDDSGSLDVMIKNPKNDDIYMIEVKSNEEIFKYTNIKNESKIKQSFSYAIQEKTTKIVSFYTYDFENARNMFFNVYTENILKDAQNVDDFFERWNKIFDKSDYIERNGLFNVSQSVKKYEDLESISEFDTKVLFNQFSTILRLHSISDKPNAFMKMINLFLAKIGDEVSANKKYNVKDKEGNIHVFNGVKFQFIYGVDTPESFMKRLNELYKTGMFEYLNKDVIDYNDEEIEKFIHSKKDEELLKIFDDLRLKKNNNFAFIDVFDDDTFLQNYDVVKSVVELLENFRFKYETKHQFLGDFFEELLNTSLKQEAGQFFTPYPIVDFMVSSLPYNRIIKENIDKKANNIVPSVIDYACGAGHFLISSMAETQKCINCLNIDDNFTEYQVKKINTWKEDPYSWVSKENVVGIEKDYRLAKTTKIATFLNGDGDAEIISGDGINKFSSKDYQNTELFSDKKRIEKFDFLISNPPYSIDGFMRNFQKNGINEKTGDFQLLKAINYSDSAIETFFVERAEQLVKKGGYVAIVLPQSVLSNSKYNNMRTFILDNFRVKCMLLTSDITFSGTTTSPVIFILKKEKVLDNHYNVLIAKSPKYSNPTGTKLKTKEVNFLGYEFSSNRAKTGITIHKGSLLSKIAPIMHSFIVGESINIPPELRECLEAKFLDNIIINISQNYCGDIYPKYNHIQGNKLSSFCSINARKPEDFSVLPTKYIEIGDLLNLKACSKHKNSTRYCKKGDILLSSLCPRKSHIVISDGDYKCSPAIHVLSGFKNEAIRDKVFNELKMDYVIGAMNTLLDGFKVTYAKISEDNLRNNIILKI